MTVLTNLLKKKNSFFLLSRRTSYAGEFIWQGDARSVRLYFFLFILFLFFEKLIFAWMC